MPASAGPAKMPPTMALSTMTVRLFIRKPTYTRQITGRKPRQVSRFARNMPDISRPTSSKKRPTPVLRGASFSTPGPAMRKSFAEGKRPILLRTLSCLVPAGSTEAEEMPIVLPFCL